MSFYGVVMRVPWDVICQLPQVADSVLIEHETAQIYTPYDSDLDVNEISATEWSMAKVMHGYFIDKWIEITKHDQVKYFAQLEKGKEFFHIHYVIEMTGMKSMCLGRYLNVIEGHVIRETFNIFHHKIDDFITVDKTRTNGPNRQYNEDFILAYLIPKVQPELQWAWTTIDKFERAALNLAERRRLSEEFQLGLAARREEARLERISNNTGNPKICGKSSRRYMELVNWLVEKGVTSERDWIKEDQESYLSYNATGSSRGQIKAALENACRIMSTVKQASDYLVGSEFPEDIEKNRVYRIFQLNGYDPAYAGSIFLGWCRRQFGKRNTIWLFGPATTGKTNIAEAVAHAVPFYGCVNWTNENFPFNDCVDKMIIWWEEGKMTAKIVESAKAILGGSTVRVDQKCKSSCQIEQTPVIVTSNTNMCAVIDGNSTTFEHQQPLEDRMFKFELTTRLQSDFGKISKAEIKEFLAWADANRVEVNHEFRVQRLYTHVMMKRPAPAREEPMEGINTAKKLKTESVAAVPSEGEEDFGQRYVNRCTNHINLSVMRFPCKFCAKMNQTEDICFTHGAKSCEICFPPNNVVKLSPVKIEYEEKKEQIVEAPKEQILLCEKMADVEEEIKKKIEEERNFVEQYGDRCNICKMRGWFNPKCGLCAEIKGLMDDLNKEQ